MILSVSFVVSFIRGLLYLMLCFHSLEIVN